MVGIDATNNMISLSSLTGASPNQSPNIPSKNVVAIDIYSYNIYYCTPPYSYGYLFINLLIYNFLLVNSTGSMLNLQDTSMIGIDNACSPTGYPLRIAAVKANLYDSDIQILLFDTESLISHLLHFDKVSSDELEDSQDEDGITFTTNSDSGISFLLIERFNYRNYT